MRRNLTALVLAILALSASVCSAYALAIALPPPGPQRMGNADTLVVGRVVGIEPEDKEVEHFPGAGGKTKFRIAVVKVNEMIRGPKDAKMIRVAFFPPPVNDPNNPVIIRPRPGLGRGNMNFEVGNDGLFILNKHHKEDFYLPPQMFNFVSSQQEDNFKKEVEGAKRAAKIMDDPMASLKSKKSEERMDAASMLITKYRNPGPAAGYKFERIPAAESKLILNALLEGPWNPQQRFGQIDSWNLFNQLGLEQDKESGWKFPQNVQNISQFHDAAKAWLKDNADKYRIQRMVPTDKPNNPQGRPGVITPDGPVQIQPFPLPVEGGPIQIQPLPAPPINPRPIRVQPGVILPPNLPQPAPLPIEAPAQPIRD